ncbi:hypothetical protein PISL3812_05924 [Talaromyces islandicus]|uniref:PHD-type domain-containing protein n=1 Tax=Talaromyces islandicus TaxID=28573 RepID=A0A0U1M029_TALIS|nr:hypothetical protein PISL3812_05924 [Talaromyces islandicus]
MPRTRTKFIWPPPNLAGDHTEQQQQQQQQQQRQPQKKQKLESSEQHRNNDNSPAPSSSDTRENSQSAQAEWDPTSNVAPPSFEAVIRAYSQVPLEKMIKNYQNWRRHGSVHDDYCMMCHRPRPQGLVPCYTCRRSFHDECMPAGSLYNDSRQWYCAVCVQRNWHVQPPAMTPPASPSLSAQHNVSGADTKPAARETTAEDSQALSILAEISRSMRRDVSQSQTPGPNHSHTDNNHNNNSNNTGNTRNSYTATSKPSARSGPLAQPSPSTQTFSLLDSHARKSRFTTLSSEVDSALWVLYRELESATSLRQRIADLEAEVVKLRQDVSIRDNQIILSQRSAPKAASVSQAELEELRIKAAKWDACVPELEHLRARNDALEQSLRDARSECVSKDEALNEWKGRLASLIGP